MRNTPEWRTRKEMDASLDGLKGHIQSMSILRDLRNSTFNACTGTFEYSENKFTELFKKDQWDDNMMRSSYMHNLNRLLESRGFKVIRPSLKKKLEQMQVKYDWAPVKDLVKQERNEKFNRYLRSALPEADISLEEYLDRITRSNSYAMHSPVKKHSVHTTVTTLFFGSRPVVSISKASICAAYAHTHTSEALF